MTKKIFILFISLSLALFSHNLSLRTLEKYVPVDEKDLYLKVFLREIKDGDLKAVHDKILMNRSLVNKSYTNEYDGVIEILNPVLVSAICKDSRMIEVIIKAKPSNINAKDANGRTACHFAAAYGSTEALKLLKNNGADINIKDNYGISPIDYALMYNQTNAFREILMNNKFIDKDELLFDIVEKGDKECSDFLDILKGSQRFLDVNIVNHNGVTPLMIAASNTNHNSVKFLLQNGADLRLEDDLGFCVYDYALDSSIINLLKEDFDTTTNNTNTNTNTTNNNIEASNIDEGSSTTNYTYIDIMEYGKSLDNVEVAVDESNEGVKEKDKKN